MFNGCVWIMKTKHPCWSLLLFVFLAPAAVLGSTAADFSYRLLKQIALPGEAGWNPMAVDAAARRLYIPRGMSVLVLDMDKDQVVGEILGTPGVRGFALAPELGLGFSSNGGEDKVSIIDLKTGETTAKVPTASVPDAILFEPVQREVYVFCARGQSVTVIDPKTTKVVATIVLPGTPAFAVADSRAARVFCAINLPGAGDDEVAAIDIRARLVVEHWSLQFPLQRSVLRPASMAMDEASHRLFIGCNLKQDRGIPLSAANTNGLMLMMSITNGKIITKVKTGLGIRGSAYDAATRLAFCSSGVDGNVVIVHEDSPERLSAVQALKTARGADTLALDPTTHKIYLPAAEYEPMMPTTPGVAPHPPRVIPGTCKVLVYGLEQ